MIKHLSENEYYDHTGKSASPTDVFDMMDQCVMYMGAEEALEAVVRAMGTDSASDIFAYIFRNYEIPYPGEEEEDLYESRCGKKRRYRETTSSIPARKPDSIDLIEESEEFYDMGTGYEYWYFTKHGLGPGTVPRGLPINDWIDVDNGTYFSSPMVISYQALRDYEIKDEMPPEETKEDDLDFSEFFKNGSKAESRKRMKESVSESLDSWASSDVAWEALPEMIDRVANCSDEYKLCKKGARLLQKRGYGKEYRGVDTQTIARNLVTDDDCIAHSVYDWLLELMCEETDREIEYYEYEVDDYELTYDDLVAFLREEFNVNDWLFEIEDSIKDQLEHGFVL